MAFCTTCGKELPEGAVFCLNCGASAPSAYGAAPQQSYAQQQGYPPQQGYAQQQGYPPQTGGKKKVGLIIGIGAAVLVIGVAVMLILLPGGKGSDDQPAGVNAAAEEESASGGTFSAPAIQQTDYSGMWTGEDILISGESMADYMGGDAIIKELLWMRLDSGGSGRMYLLDEEVDLTWDAGSDSVAVTIQGETAYFTYEDGLLHGVIDTDDGTVELILERG